MCANVAIVRGFQQKVSQLTLLAYAASMSMNYFLVKTLQADQDVPPHPLTQNSLYNCFALFLGQGKNAPPNVKDAFDQFKTVAQ